MRSPNKVAVFACAFYAWIISTEARAADLAEISVVGVATGVSVGLPTPEQVAQCKSHVDYFVSDPEYLYPIGDFVNCLSSLASVAPEKISVIGCQLAVGTSNLRELDSYVYYDFFGRAFSCGNYDSSNATGFNVNLSGRVELRDIFTGAVLSGSIGLYPTSNPPLNWPFLVSGASYGYPSASPPTVPVKVKFHVTIDTEVYACPSSNPSCPITWIAVPNKSVSTATRFACIPDGNDLECEIDSPPFYYGAPGRGPLDP